MSTVKYRPGSYWVYDDRTGFRRRAEDTRKEWTGLRVGADVWEPRQPQDLVRGREDKQAVPDPRTEPPDVFVGPISAALTADVPVGQTVISLEGTAGFQIGDAAGVILFDGSIFRTSLVAVGPESVTLAAPLPLPATSGSLLTDYR